MSNTPRIPALWFNSKGHGPDELALELHPFAAEEDGAIPASLGIRVRVDGLVIQAGPLVDGGFNMHRNQVDELHRQLGEWLAATPKPASLERLADDAVAAAHADVAARVKAGARLLDPNNAVDRAKIERNREALTKALPSADEMIALVLDKSKNGKT